MTSGGRKRRGVEQSGAEQRELDADSATATADAKLDAKLTTKSDAKSDSRQAGPDTNSPKSSITSNNAFKLFWSFLKIGAFTFGGGYAMIPLIQREVVDKHKWVESDKFLDLLTLAQSAPGPISLNTAVFVGYNLDGYRGAVCAVLGIVLPTFFVMLLIAIYFVDVKDNRVVAAIFAGIRPAVVALIAAPVFRLARGINVYGIVIALSAAAAVWLLGISPIYFIVIGAVGGIAWSVWGRKLFKAEGEDGERDKKRGGKR